MGIPLRVLDVARSVIDEVNRLIDGHTARLLYVDQLRDALQSIAANLREAQGRRPGPERNQFLRYALGSSQEADEHLRANMAARRIPERQFWRLHHRLTLTRKMTESLMASGPSH